MIDLTNRDSGLLTKEERLTVYKSILEDYIKNGWSATFGFCITCANVTKNKILFNGYNYLNIYDENDFSRQLPELFKYRPRAQDMVSLRTWFGLDEEGINKRITILKEIISNMENKE